ncbi:MAG TPA: DUF1330 domain-containing protein [Steroidobacteraceae bacterium]|nr:DUF1330 domain-containing protein [Steroidobacteraceae bacterium]
MPPAYVISEVDILDEDLAHAYRRLAAESVAQYGGRYLVRGGNRELIEGGPPPKAIIVIEFPSVETARAWYASPAYAEALELRAKALERRLILVEGAAH